MTSNRKLFAAVLAFSIGIALGLADQAAAASQKKITREQAWKLCKAQLDKEGTASNMTTNDRYLRGGACLQKYGYSL
jgi:hypothetical protein